ncbi:unnamed protein product, partial [Symbiodinium necroappetens]
EGARWEASAASGGEDHKPRADTASTAVVSSSAGHTSTSLEGVESVAWESLAFRQDLWPLRSYAHHPEDIPLISKFLELTPLTSIVPAAGKLLLRVLRFLHMCDYRLEDICAILAHASAYFMDVYSQCAGMQATEVGHILATLIFIAHCYVQDETCPLNIWQKHLFKKYCSLKVLNMAVIRLLEIRRYRLRLPQDDLWKRLEALASSIATCTSIDTSFGRPPPLSSGSPTAPQAQIAGGDDRREGRGYDSSQRTGERPLASSSLHGNGASGNRSAGASVFASIARRTLSRIRATEDRARDLSSRLQSMPPICKYKGFIPASRELCGETFTQQCLSARETPRTAGGGTPFEAWAKTGVGAAGRIVCQGKGLRVDLQEQHAAEQCRAGLATIMSARDKRAPFLLSGNRQPRNQAIQLSYNPGSQRTRADATCMEAAGAVSFCRRFDQFRQENYRRAIFEAIRNNEMSAGRQPPCSSREVKGEAVWPSTHPGGPATMACQFSEGWSGTPMWQLAQGREETMRKEREAREAQAGDVLEIDNEAAGFRSVLYVSRMVGDKYDDSKVRGPRRKTRAQAIKDGLSLRNACRDAPKDAKLEAAQRRSVELMYTFWKPEELPKEDFDFEESVEKPMRSTVYTVSSSTPKKGVGHGSIKNVLFDSAESRSGEIFCCGSNVSLEHWSVRNELLKFSNKMLSKQCEVADAAAVIEKVRVCDPVFGEGRPVTMKKRPALMQQASAEKQTQKMVAAEVEALTCLLSSVAPGYLSMNFGSANNAGDEVQVPQCTLTVKAESREGGPKGIKEVPMEKLAQTLTLHFPDTTNEKCTHTVNKPPRRQTRRQQGKGHSQEQANFLTPILASKEIEPEGPALGGELTICAWAPDLMKGTQPASRLLHGRDSIIEMIEDRLRLARKPRGNGWQRVGDKAELKLAVVGAVPLQPLGSGSDVRTSHVVANDGFPASEPQHFSVVQWCARSSELQPGSAVVWQSQEHAAAWEPALAMLHQLETGAFGIQPTVHHYGAVASCLEFVKNWEKALALMRSLQSRGLMPSVQFCGAIITACEKSCQWERALSLLRRMGELSAGPDVMAFNTSIAACGKGRRWKDAVLLLAEMSSSELLPSVVMSALERSRQWMLAVMIMDGILARGLEADYITWNSVISACESGSQWAQALRMLHRARLCFVADPSGMPQKLKRGTNSVISACGKASRWPLGVQLLRMMREDGPDGTQDHVKQPAMDMDILCFNSLLLHMNGAHWKTAACLLQEMVLLKLSADLTTYRGCTIAFQEGACHSRFYYQIAQSAVELPRALRSVERFRQEEHAIEVALTASRLRGLHCLPLQADRIIQRVVEAPARASLSLLSLRSEFFRHCSAPMAFDPVKGRYLKIDAETNSYIDCDVPHDPIEYSVSVSVGASLVGQTDEDLNAPDRPRTMLLKELVKTGAAMKTPLFFLDQPAACFAMFDGVRGGAAVEWCSKHLHTKLLPQLSASITYWHDADLRGLLRSILSELDVQLVQQAGCCWEGVSIAVALLLGDRLVVASLGGTHALVAAPDGRWRSLDGRHVASSAEEQARSKALGAEIVGEEKGKGVVGAPFVQKAVKARDWQVVEDATAEEEVARVLDRTSDCFATLGLGPEDKIDGKAARSCYKKLALKVHPDKAPEELKARAKAAFEKVEKAAADVEAFCETDVEATECLHRILHAAGPKRASMLR